MAMATVSDPPATRRFTADEVWKMVEIGLLGPGEPYELIGGELRYVSPQGPPHAWIIRHLTAVLVPAYGPRFDVGVQLPIGGIVDSIPEPDLAVTPAVASMDEPHPRADETLLIIEVSSNGRRTDQARRRSTPAPAFPSTGSSMSTGATWSCTPARAATAPGGPLAGSRRVHR